MDELGIEYKWLDTKIIFHNYHEWLETKLIYKWYTNVGCSFTVRIGDQPTIHIGYKYKWL